MSAGLLDLPAPLLTSIDALLGSLGLPPLLRVVLYASGSAWLSMAIYRRWSRQQDLQEASTAARALRAELSSYDGPFDGLMTRVKALLGLNARHLRLSLVPALLGGLPLLLLMPWLSNQFGLLEPTPGSLILVVPEGLERDGDSLTWSDPSIRWDPQAEGWHVAWPAPDSILALRDGSHAVASLPLVTPVSVVHRRMPLFNLLIGNPAGYLADDAPMSALRLEMPHHDLHGIGPAWMRGWLAVYLSVMLAASLGLKWRWKLH